MACLLSGVVWISGCGNSELKQLKQENANLKAEIERLKAEQKTTDRIIPSPTPTPSQSPEAPAVTTLPADQIKLEDIQGVFGEKAITQVAQLGVLDATSGKFNPQQPVTRAEFVRWLVRANNAIWADKPDKMVRLAEAGAATFTDVPTTHPDFQYIQGMANAGFAVGYDAKTFKPNQPLTREQMIAIKAGLDSGGVDTLNTDTLNGWVPMWTDRNQIAKRFIASFNTEYRIENSNNRNVERTFGAIKAFKPQTPVTRAEAVVCISAVGDHSSLGETRSAEMVLKGQTKQPSL